MAPQPKRKHSLRRGRIRTQALSLTNATLTPCPSCQKLRMAHRVCPHCGFYDGKAVFLTKEKSEKKASGQKRT